MFSFSYFILQIITSRTVLYYCLLIANTAAATNTNGLPWKIKKQTERDENFVRKKRRAKIMFPGYYVRRVGDP